MSAMRALPILLPWLLAAASAGCASGGPARPVELEWVPLFDGESLDGWTPKIVGLPVGEDPWRTFRVREGLLVVDTSDYPGDFEGRFGHLFFELPLSHYELRIEYRFVGEQHPGGPAWAWRNSGLMLHAQDPSTMGLVQAFPVSIEAQLLGSEPGRERPNANLCTPGTHVELEGALVTRHCTDSDSGPSLGDDWVTVELEVRGAERVVHRVEGEPVLTYGGLVLDPDDLDAARLLELGAGSTLDRGYLALQSESHGLEVRRLEVRLLPEPPR
jgi:hypothetical protein